MIKSLFFSLLVATSFSARASSEILGVWSTENDKSQVEIYKDAGKIYGKIISLKEPLNDEGEPKVDRHNPDKELQSRPIVGLVIIKDLVETSPEHWGEGKIYDPQSGKTYNLKASIESENKLKVRGFIGLSLFGKSQTWNRVVEK